jgi:hypothetical protein
MQQFDRTAMHLYDLAANGEAKACAFARGLSRKKRLKNTFPYLGWNAMAIILKENKSVMGLFFANFYAQQALVGRHRLDGVLDEVGPHLV